MALDATAGSLSAVKPAVQRSRSHAAVGTMLALVCVSAVAVLRGPCIERSCQDSCHWNVQNFLSVCLYTWANFMFGPSTAGSSSSPLPAPIEPPPSASPVGPGRAMTSSKAKLFVEVQEARTINS